MKLVIHCGLHKTATTSFQLLCAKNRALLHRCGVLFPELGPHMQHSYLMHEIQSLGIDVLTDYLRTSRATAGASCETVLLSGEDFENCIVDLALAREVESAAHIAGFSAVEWHVVVRPRDATCDSLYAEMSKHGVVLDRAVMQQAAERRGCFYASTAAFNYIFVLDYPRLAPRFAKAISGKIVDYSMDAFTRHHPGMILLERLLAPDAFAAFCAEAVIDPHHANARLSARRVERNYLLSALGSEVLNTKAARPLIAALVTLRLDMAKRPRKAQ